MAAALLGVSSAHAESRSDSGHASDGSPPNVILIVADDLGYGDVGCYGQQRIKTPNIDRLAAGGMGFTDAYSGAPVCAPSRCVLMTGLHGGHARIRGNRKPTEPGAALLADDVTLASVLKEAGYATGIVGKWGLGEPTVNRPGLPRAQGFDYFYGYLRQGHAHNYYPDYLWRNESVVRLSRDDQSAANDTPARPPYSHDLLAEEGLKFVRRNRARPFFLYWALTIPHANTEKGAAGMETPDYGDYANVDWPEPQKGHAAMISRMDRDVGRMLSLLNDLGLERQTLVIFTSDNGPHREGGNDPDFNDSNGPLRGYKGNVTEGGIRVPFIARWPGRIPSSKTVNSPVAFVDMLPTLAAIAGVDPPICLDGVSVAPTLWGERQPELADRFLYWEYYKHGVQMQGARRGRWKAIRNPRSNQLALYDLRRDIGEAHDVASQRASVATEFRDYFNSARTPSPHWPMFPAPPERSVTSDKPAA